MKQKKKLCVYANEVLFNATGCFEFIQKIEKKDAA